MVEKSLWGHAMVALLDLRQNVVRISTLVYKGPRGVKYVRMNHSFVRVSEVKKKHIT